MSDPAPAAPTADQPLATALFCPGCGYDLRGIAASDRCPECGLAIDRSAGGVSRIPWAHRRRVGRVRAYWATVRLATFRPRQLVEELNRPVRYADAQRFRIVTVALASLGPIAFLLAPMVAGEWPEPADAGAMFNVGFYGRATGPNALDLGLPWFAGARLYPVLPLAVVLLFVLVTGVGSYWFAPRSLDVRQQNRAIALSYYALLPLVAIVVGLQVLAAAALGENSDLGFKLLMVLVATCIAATVLILFTLGRTTVRLLHAVRRGRGVGGALWADFFIFLSVVAAAVVSFGVFPWVVGFVTLVVDSFL
jgi:hypothetical protein